MGVWEYDIVSQDLVWDDRMNEIYGLPADGGQRYYTHWRDRLHSDDLDRASEDFRIAVEVTGHYHSDYRIVTPDGESVLVDSGNPGGRDAPRIHRVATEVAGLKRID